MPRKLRIAVSVFFGVLTLALCVLWVRSYGAGGYVYFNVWKYRSFLVGLSNGRAMVHTETFTMGRKRLKWVSSRHASHVFRWRPLPTFASRIENGFQLVIPGACVVVAPALIAAAAWPWYSPRFSLRTLLLATTLVAAVLGFGVWLSQ